MERIPGWFFITSGTGGKDKAPTFKRDDIVRFSKINVAALINAGFVETAVYWKQATENYIIKGKRLQTPIRNAFYVMDYVK